MSACCWEDSNGDGVIDAVQFMRPESCGDWDYCPDNEGCYATDVDSTFFYENCMEPFNPHEIAWCCLDFSCESES